MRIENDLNSGMFSEVRHGSRVITPAALVVQESSGIQLDVVIWAKIDSFNHGMNLGGYIINMWAYDTPFPCTGFLSRCL